jgi:hypothetical protein
MALAHARLAAEVIALVTRHWELKLLALAFSAALWFFVMTTERADLILSAPVEVEGLPAGVVVTGEVPDSVDVQLHGLRGVLSRLSANQVRARLNLAGARPGEMTVRLLPGQVAVPPGITVLRVMPSQVRVVLSAAPGPQPRPEAPRS